jgi:hypothetical protein
MRTLLLFVLALFLAHSACGSPSAYRIRIGNITHAEARLVVTFLDGGSPANAVTITELDATRITFEDGVGSGSFSGGLPGTLTLSDAAFFSDYQLALVGDDGILSLRLDFTNRAPDEDAFADGFALYLLDPSDQSIMPSSDPTGAQALLVLDGGASAPVLYTPNIEFDVLQPVPEPAAIWLWLIGGVAVLLRAARASRGGLPLARLAAAALLALAPHAHAAVSGCYHGTPGCNDQDTWTRHVPEFNWMKGVLLPRDLWWQSHLHASQVVIRWGDGQETRYTSANAQIWGGGQANANLDPASQQRILENENQCFNTVADCTIVGRHTYQQAGDYQICVTIQVTNTPRNPPPSCTWAHIRDYPAASRFNVLALGDSLSSGEGAPSSATTWAGAPGASIPFDLPQWELRFHSGEREAHRSFYSAPSWASYQLQKSFADAHPAQLRVAVDFWDRSFSGAITDSDQRIDISQPARTVYSQVVADDPPQAPGQYDAIIISAGANDLPLRALIEYCVFNSPGCSGLYARPRYNGTTLLGFTSVDEILNGLVNRLTAMDQQIKSRVQMNKAKVYVTGYFSFSTSLSCLAVLQAGEQAYVDGIVERLNQKIQDAATLLGWTYVPRDYSAASPIGDGVDHGLCAGATYNPVRWLLSLDDSNVLQGNGNLVNSENFQGFLHPGYTGQKRFGLALRDAMLAQARGKAACAAVPLGGVKVEAGPLRYDYRRKRYMQQVTMRNLSANTSPGEVVLRLGGLDPTVQVRNAQGGACGPSSVEPTGSYLLLGGGIGPYQSFTRTLEFDNPHKRPIVWAPTVLAAGYF